MWNLFNRTKELAVGSRERCGRVCDAGCRPVAQRERAMLQELWLGVRV
jgi:hypothetical protein